MVLPGTIEAEAYDAGGEGITYHDSELQNLGAGRPPTCRAAEGIDIEPCQDPQGGLFNIGWTRPGEWTRYSVAIVEAGHYRVDARVATTGAAQIHLELDETNISGPINFTTTGGWQNWVTVSDTVFLPSGDHLLYLRMDTTLSGNDGNINQLRFSRVTLAAPALSSPANGTPGLLPIVTLSWRPLAGATSYRIQLSTSSSFSTLAYDSSGIAGISHKVEWLSGATQYWWRVYAEAFGGFSAPSAAWSFTTRGGPYMGSPVSLPGTIEVSQYDGGGEGITYHDTDAENLGASSKYRTSEGVDIERCQDPDGSRYNIAWTSPGEWLRYSITVTQSGFCRMDARVATPWDGRFHLELDGTDISGPVRFGNTGGWQSWMTVSDTVYLIAGNHQLHLRFDDTASSSYAGNINQLQFTPLEAPMAVSLLSPPDGATKQPTVLTLLWRSVPTATWYELQCGIDSLETFVRVDTFRVMSLLPGVRYSWRVRARSLSGLGPYSPTWYLTTATPLPGKVTLNEQLLATADSCTFTWRREPAATRYWFEISLDSVFGAFSSIDSLVADTAETIHGLENGQTYYWRVRGGNESEWGEFSEPGRTQVVITGLVRQVIPTEFALLANYPNPFNPSTTIRFELPKAVRVYLAVYDMLGQEVSILVNETREAGTHEVKFSGSGLASGLYIYRIQAGDFVQSRELVLLK